MSDGLPEELSKAWAKIESLRELLRSLEWEGAVVVGFDGITAACCPACGGIKPGENLWEAEDATVGHEEDCALVAGLATT